MLHNHPSKITEFTCIGRIHFSPTLLYLLRLDLNSPARGIQCWTLFDPNAQGLVPLFLLILDPTAFTQLRTTRPFGTCLSSICPHAYHVCMNPILGCSIPTLNQPTRKTRRSTPRRSALPLHQFQSFHTTHLLLVVHSPGHPLLVLCSQGESRTSSCSSFPRPNSYLRTSSPPPTAATIPSANEREFLVRIPNRKVVGPSQLPELSRVQLPPFQNKPLRS